VRPLLVELPAWLTGIVAAALVVQFILQFDLPAKWRLPAAGAGLLAVVVLTVKYWDKTLPLHAYGVMLAVAGVVAITIGVSRARLAGFGRIEVLDFGLYVVLCGVVGARVFHVIEAHEHYFGPDRYVEAVDAVPSAAGEAGAKVTRVVPGSPPAEAGLEPGDVIVEIAEIARPRRQWTVRGAADLSAAVESLLPGPPVRVSARRGGRPVSVQTQLRSGGGGMLGALAVWNGGLVFYGGLIGGMVYAVYFALRQKDGLRALVRMYDLGAPCVLFGLAFGRVGCFLNGCCFGRATGLPWAVAYPRGSNLWRAILTPGAKAGRCLDSLPLIGGMPSQYHGDARQLAAWINANVPHTYYVHPAQLYASLGALAIGVFLSWAFYRRFRLGTVSCLWLLTYPVYRFILEGWARSDTEAAFPAVSSWLTISQYVSMVGFAAGVVWLVVLLVLARAERRAAGG